MTTPVTRFLTVFNRGEEGRRQRRRPSISRQRRRPSIKRLALLVPGIILLGVALGEPILATYDPTLVVGPPNRSPSAEFLFGTNSSGLDVYSRVIAATQLNLAIGLLAVLFATVLGAVVGLLVGMNESRSGLIGFLARGVARGIDLFQAIPAIVIGLVLVAFLGSSPWTILVALSLIMAPIQARLVRVEVLHIRGESFIDAARLSGVGGAALLFREILPNALGPALANSTAMFASSAILTATLGFLGVGIQPPTPEWGSMISSGASDVISGRWWSVFFPAAAMVYAIVAFALAGHALSRRRD